MPQFFNLGTLGLATSLGQNLATWLNQMQQAFPGFQPSQANPLTVQANVFGSWSADVGTLASAGSQELLRQMGTKLFGVPYQQGTPATAIATVTAVDTLGHTLPAGTQLTLTLNGTPLAFQTVSALTIGSGASTGTVTVAAVQNGVAFNGATNPATLVAQINWVSGVSVAAPATGGNDQENDTHYLNRLVAVLQTMALRPITATDYATVALNFVPAAGTDQQLVGRAAAIDGYDPATNTYGNQREVTVAVTDSSGNALNTDTMYGIGGSSSSIVTNSAQWGVAGWLRSLRETGFIVNVLAPNYTTVYVAVTVKGAQGYTAATVQANVQAALLGYLSPASFGLPQGASVGWQNQTAVPLSQVMATVQGVLGVQRVLPGTLAVDTNPSPTNTTNDLVLAGPFPLPTSSSSSIPLAAVTVV